MTSTRNDWSQSINVPVARDRLYEYFEREQLPGDVNSVLANALNGDLHQFSLLCTAMIDSWPKLQKAINEIAGMAAVAPWKVHPYAERGEKPTPKAEAQAKEVESLMWGMKPRAEYHEQGLEDTIKTMVKGFYYGHAVNEIRWERNAAGLWQPRCTKLVPARYYGYNYDGMIGASGEDRLMFDPVGGNGMRNFEDFPQHRFLIAINSSHLGHAAVGSPMRALCGYWLAATYGLKWFMNFTQLYGIPWRHAEVDNPNDITAVNAALDEMGGKARITTRSGVKLNILSPGSTVGASLPQRELIALADQQCEQFILGQTLTSGTDGSGSRALGEVHENTLHGVVDTVTDFVGGILTNQMIPAIVALNWGDSMKGELPEFWAKREKVKDEKSLAERDKSLRDAFPELEWSKAYLHERHGLPVPTGDDLLVLEPDPSPIVPSPHLSPLPVAAADASTVKESLTVDQLSRAVLEGLTGVSREWLSPVRPVFERLAALAMSNVVTDEDFIAALEKAQRELPEMFDLLDTGTLQTAFEKAIGSAALAGSVRRYEK